MSSPASGVISSKQNSCCCQSAGDDSSHFHSPISQSRKTQMPAKHSPAFCQCIQSVASDFVLDLVYGAASFFMSSHIRKLAWLMQAGFAFFFFWSKGEREDSNEIDRQTPLPRSFHERTRVRSSALTSLMMCQSCN